MSTIHAEYLNGNCDNCNKSISVMDKIPAIIILPYEELRNASLLLCVECARKIRGDYTVETYFKLVDEAKERELKK